jgi:hypothetical protein
LSKWLQIPDATKTNAYHKIAEQTGMSPFAVEKDWWVTQTLSAVFDMEVAKHLVFKGGTSLSKAWGLIHRFSEDIDLAIDRSYLGYHGDLSRHKLSQLRKAAGKYTTGPFFNELISKFESKGITDIKFEVVEAVNSDQDPRVLNIFYPNVINPPGYIEPRVQLEIGCRSLRMPFSERTFGSLIDDHFSDQNFISPLITIDVVNPERTFLEKLFLLHEEFKKPLERIRVNRLSRHLYDVSKLANSPYAERAFSNSELYSTIVDHRHKFTRIGGIDYNLHQPQSLDPIPPEGILPDWEKDYNIMRDTMIYEQNPPTFSELLESVIELKERINNLPWRMSKKFPPPRSK